MPIRRKPADDYSRFDETDLPQDAASAVDGYSQFDATDIPQEPPPAPPPPPPPEEPGFLEKATGYAVGSAKTIGRVMGSAYEELGAGLAGAVKGVADVGAASSMTGLDYVFNKKLSEAAKGAREEFKAVSERVLPKAEIAAQPWLSRSVISGLQSFAQQAPGLAVSLLTKNPAPALTSATLSTTGESYARADEAGLPLQQAVLYGLTDGVIELATELAPTGTLVKAMSDTPGFWPAAKQFAKQELWGETQATWYQKLNEFATFSPEKPISEFLKTLPEETASTVVATIVGIGAQTGLMRTLQAVGGREPKEPEKKPSILDEIEAAQQEPPSTGQAEIADLEATQDRARAAAEAQGGDALDQEVAASQAALDQTAAARQNKDAAFAYAEQQIKAMQDQAKSVAFDTAEETAAARKPIEQDILARQGEAQAAIDAAKGAPETAAPATLADVWPAKPATLAERRAQAAPAPSLPIFTGRADDSGTGWGASRGSLGDGTKSTLLVDTDGTYFWGDRQLASARDIGRVIVGAHSAYQPAKFRTGAEARAAAEKTSATAPKAAAAPAVEAPAAAAAPLALPAPKQGPTIQTREFRTGKKGQRLKGTAPTVKEGGGTVVVDREGGARVLSENEPTVPGVKTGYGTLAIRRQAIAEERVRTPVVETTRQQVEEAAATTAASPQNDLTPPTPAQHMAENFKSAPIKIAGLDVTLQYPKGSERPIVNAQGEQVGSRTMPGHYGYIKRTTDADGQQVDVLIGDQPEAPTAFVVDQLKPEGGFEQHKVLLGYPNQVAAARAIKKMYPEKAVGPITQMSPDELKTWLREGDTTQPLKPAEIKAPVRQRAEKAEPQERPIAPPKPGKVAQQSPAPAPAPKVAKPQGPTLAERRLQSAAAKAKNETDRAVAEAKNETAKAVAEAKAAVTQKAEPKTEGPKLRYAEPPREFPNLLSRRTVDQLKAARESERQRYGALSTTDAFQGLSEDQKNAAFEDHNSRVTAFTTEILKKERGEQEAKDFTATEVEEVFPGFREIPAGTRIKYRKDIRVDEVSEGVVVGVQRLRGGGKIRNYPVIAAPGTLWGKKVVFPAQLVEVYAPRNLRYGETLTLRPKWKRSVSPAGLVRWDYGKRGSVEERVDAEGNSRFFANLTLRSSKGAFDMSDKLGHLTEDAAKEYVERYSKQGETLQALDNTFAQARDTISRDFKAVPPEERRPTGVPEPGPKPEPVSLVDAEAAVQRFIDKLGSRYQVLRSPEQAPPHIYEQMKKDGRLDAPGVYDVDNDVAYTFADNNLTVEDVQRNAAHEVVAHMGWRRLGSVQEHNETMEQIFSMAEDKTWMSRFITGHGLNENNPADRLLAADEYVAHVAESGTDLPVLKKMVAYARFLLRKMNPNLTWTEDDIRLMLFRAKTNLLKGSGHAWHWPKQTGIRYASKPTPASALKAGPEGMAIRQDMTLEQLSQYNPRAIRSRWSAVQDLAHGRKETLMALVHLNNLPDFVAPGKMDSAGKYALEVDNTEGDFSAEIGQYAPLAEKAGKFVRKNPAVADKLAELMHAATLSRADPAQDYKPLHSGKRRVKNKKTGEVRVIDVKLTDDQVKANRDHQRAWQVLRTHWDALGKMGFMGKTGKDAQALYVEIRDAYAQLNKDIWAALEQRINETNSDAEHKSTLLATLRKEFEHGSVAPYFSLFRKGKFWAVAKRLKTAEELERAPAKTEADKWVVEYFVRSDHSAEIEAFQANMKRAGYETPSGEVKGSDQEILDSVDPAFVAKITELTKEQGSKQLADEIWQLYLQRLPEMSIRKHYAHRKGRLGFTKDFVQAYSHHMFHGAHQLARMRHVYKLETHLQNAAKELRALEESNDPEKRWAAPLLRELQRRHQWVMNPETAGWSNLMAAGGFFWYLANSPAAGAVQITSTTTMTWPRLAARFGAGPASREISRAAKLWSSSWGPTANKLRGWERAVMDEAVRTNLFQTTAMHTMVSMGEQGVEAGTRMHTTMQVSSYIFHKGEQFNREVAYLAAARLYAARQPQAEGESSEAFVARTAAYARRLVFLTQGDYANTNRPRILQGNVMKVVGLFRQWGFHVLYRLTRDFDTWWLSNRYDTETDEQFTARKREARYVFLGTLAQTSLYTGLRGMPVYWLAQIIANAIWGDDDEPYDVDAAMQKQLEDKFGEATASVIMEGPVATAAGAKLSNRIGLNNLIFQEVPSNKYGADLAAFFVAQLGGPYLSQLYNTADWLYPKEEGYEDRAFEKVVPKWVRDPMRTIRFAQDGVTTKTGDEIIPRRELSEWDLAVQGFGFSPLKIATAHERNRAAQGHALKLNRREDNLRNKYNKYHNQIVIATKAGDTKAVAEAQKAQDAVWEESKVFVQKNPTSSLLSEMGSSIRDRKRREVMSIRGIYLDRRLRHLYDRYGVKAPEPPAEKEAE